MAIRIFRYPEPRQKTMDPRSVVLLEISPEGEESELEVLEVNFRDLRLKNLVEDQVEQGHLYFVLDLSHEKHIDSSDLAEILDAWQQAGAANGELVIAHPNAKILEILRITKLDQVIKNFDSVEAATNHLSART